ncbi:MAG: glycosyltransferase family 2 protein [Dehalococcoidia bacterium]|nr:glycosyltransferase family 2 protein [Dehalococcoidia bacterium]
MSTTNSTRPEPAPFLSVVIPAFNEGGRIADTLQKAIDYLGTQEYTWDVLVVDDGSTDDTAQVVGEFSVADPRVRLLSVAHGGKGWAVRHGMLQAGGEFRFLCDADLSMPIEQASRYLPPAQEEYDIAIGSREIPGARRVGEPSRRHLMGRVFNGLVRLAALPGISDTQCGFKCFRGSVVEGLFGSQMLSGFAFDVELLFLARRQSLSIVEVPIDWYYRSLSRVRPFRDSLAMALDIIKIRWNHLLGRYRRR